jgi:hypothetical protein
MCGTTVEVDALGLKLDEEQHVQRLQKQGFNGEEVTDADLLFVMGHDRLPT